MAVILRLTRMGAKKKPIYRIIAVDSRKRRGGEYIESLGNYDPASKGEQIVIKKERAEYWMANGAEISETVRSLFKKQGLLRKDASPSAAGAA